MPTLITHDFNALRLLLNEDLYMVDGLAMISAPSKEIKPVESPSPLLVKEEAALAQAKPAREFNYLGENNKYFLILLEDPTHTTLNPNHKEMILKIMGAKNLELRDLAILNLSHYPNTNFTELKSFFSPSRIALFGIDPKRLGMDGIRSNQISTSFGCQILASYSLGAMASSVDKKKEFWNIMKNF